MKTNIKIPLLKQPESLQFMRFSKNHEGQCRVCITLRHVHKMTYRLLEDNHHMNHFASLISHKHTGKPNHFSHFFKVCVSTTHLTRWLFVLIDLFHLFFQNHEIKIYTGIPQALVIKLQIFYSEIKRQHNERWNLTPRCSGHAEVRKYEKKSKKWRGEERLWIQ